MKMNNTCGVASFAMWPVLSGVKELNPLTGEVEEVPLVKAKSDEEHLKH
jgi:hypothetical protein